MYPRPPDRTSVLQVLAFGGLLVLLGFIAQWLAWRTVDTATLPGTYVSSRPAFMSMDGVPEKLVLQADGTMELYDAGDTLRFRGRWHWQPEQLLVRADAPRWDRQIRLRQTLFGPRLALRISNVSYERDPEERDDEVDLIKTGPPPLPTSGHDHRQQP